MTAKEALRNALIVSLFDRYNRQHLTGEEAETFERLKKEKGIQAAIEYGVRVDAEQTIRSADIVTELAYPAGTAESGTPEKVYHYAPRVCSRAQPLDWATTGKNLVTCEECLRAIEREEVE